MSLQTASMILRILSNAPLTTKGSELTWEELDGNLIKIYQDIAAKVKAGTIADFDNTKTYSLGDAANYDDLTWLYLNATPESGIDPGSDPAYWGEIDPTFFIHEQNKDQMLDKGGANEVTAEDLKALVNAGVLYNIYTGNGTLTADRTVDQSGRALSFINGKLTVGTASTVLPFRSTIYGNEAGVIENGTYIFAIKNALHAQSNLGLAIAAHSASGIGLASYAPWNYIRKNSTGTLPTPEPSSIWDVFTTDQGVRNVPRLTESERDAISSPADYLEIVNTTRDRKEIYLPFWGWHPVGTITPDWGYEFMDECTAANPVSGFVQAQSNGGTRGTLSNASISPSQLLGLSTGVTNNGESSHLTSIYYLGSVGKKYYKTKVCSSALSDVSNRYFSQIGYFDTNSGITNANGIYFLYDEGGVCGSATASANWLCICKNGGSYSIVDSGIAVTTTSSALQTLEIYDDGTGTNVKFYINSTLVATITTQIPDTTRVMYIGERIVKTTGTTARFLYLDFTIAKEKFNTPR